MEKYNIEPYKDKATRDDFRREDDYLRAKKRVDTIIGFYWHLAVYVVVNVFLILIIALNTGQGFSGFGPYATAVFWGIGLFFHFIAVFGFNFLFGKNWEERKMKEFMEKEQQRWE